jgi:hypothetical protein
MKWAVTLPLGRKPESHQTSPLQDLIPEAEVGVGQGVAMHRKSSKERGEP